MNSTTSHQNYKKMSEDNIKYKDENINEIEIENINLKADEKNTNENTADINENTMDEKNTNEIYSTTDREYLNIINKFKVDLNYNNIFKFRIIKFNSRISMLNFFINYEEKRIIPSKLSKEDLKKIFGDYELIKKIMEYIDSGGNMDDKIYACVEWGLNMVFECPNLNKWFYTHHLIILFQIYIKYIAKDINFGHQVDQKIINSIYEMYYKPNNIHGIFIYL